MDRLSSPSLAALERICPGGVSTGEDLSRLSQWKIGGRADLVLRPSCAREVAALRVYFAHLGVRPLVIGSTTNLLFADEGLRVPCISIGSRMAALKIDGVDVRVGAGYWVPFLARKLMQAGLMGLEHTCGIPGTLGGLICMNGGSQRKGIGSSVLEVESVGADGTIACRSAPECEFAYRQSLFQRVDEVVTSVRLRLEERSPVEMRREMLNILTVRSRKFPRKLPNCGSVFLSDPAMYAEHGPPGAIIEKLGYKGRVWGGAQVSPRHANFIVNVGGATSADVLGLIREISSAAERELGAALRAEVRYVAADGKSYPATDIPERAL